MRRLYYALWPDEPQRAALRAIAEHLHAGQGGRLLRAARYHLTLRYLGESEADDAALDAAARAVRVAPFTLHIDRAGSFAKRRIPWWLGPAQLPAELQALWTQLGEGLAAQELKPADEAVYIPHLTILREAPAPLPTRAIPVVQWPVRDFVLVESRLAHPASYDVLARWPLTGAPPAKEADAP